MIIKEKLMLIFKKTKNGFKYDDSEVVDLKEKVDMFIYWYYRNMVSGKYTIRGLVDKPIEMRYFIEKTVLLSAGIILLIISLLILTLLSIIISI